MQTPKKAKTRRFYIGIGSKICSQSAHIWPKELAPRGALLLWQIIVAPLGPIKKVLNIFEKRSCRKFGSHYFCKIKKPNKNFLKLPFNKKICIKLSFPPQQKNWHNHTTVLYTKYVCNIPKTISRQNQKN